MGVNGLGRQRVGRRWGWCILTLDVDHLGITLRALMPEYSHHRWGVHPAQLFLTPEWFQEVIDTMGDWLKKAVEAAATPEGAVHFRDTEWEKEYPALYDFLASKIGPGGKPRESACLLIFARDGEVTACLKDRGIKKSFYGRSDSVQGAIKDLDANIRNGPA